MYTWHSDKTVSLVVTFTTLLHLAAGARSVVTLRRQPSLAYVYKPHSSVSSNGFFTRRYRQYFNSSIDTDRETASRDDVTLASWQPPGITDLLRPVTRLLRCLTETRCSSVDNRTDRRDKTGAPPFEHERYRFFPKPPERAMGGNGVTAIS